MLITREHNPLIAHTADDIVTSETGLYGSSHGLPIAMPATAASRRNWRRSAPPGTRWRPR